MKNDNLTYYIPNQTKNNTNIKTYSNLKDGYTFYVDFKLNNFIENEACVIGRQDLHYMGLFLQKPNALKICWHNENGEYSDIFLEVGDIFSPMKVLVTVSDEIKIYRDGFYLASKKCDRIMDYTDKNILIGSINPHFREWECRFDGIIKEIKIFEGICTDPTSNYGLFAHYDFEDTCRFKTYDISENGNHGVVYENPEYRDFKINEYVKLTTEIQ